MAYGPIGFLKDYLVEDVFVGEVNQGGEEVDAGLIGVASWYGDDDEESGWRF